MRKWTLCMCNTPGTIFRCMCLCVVWAVCQVDRSIVFCTQINKPWCFHAMTIYVYPSVSFRLDPRLEAAGIEKVRRLCYDWCEVLCRQVSCLLLPDGGELDLHMGSHLTTKVVSILLVLYAMCTNVLHMNLHIMASAVPDKPHPDVQDTSNPKLKLMKKVYVHLYGLTL